MYRSTRAVFFLSTHLCTCTEPQLIHLCLHGIYPRVFFEQEVLRVLTKLNTSEIMCIAYARITTCDYPLNCTVQCIQKIMHLLIFCSNAHINPKAVVLIEYTFIKKALIQI